MRRRRGSRLLAKATAFAKSHGHVDEFVRHSPLFYGRVRRLASAVRDADVEARHRLNAQLLERTLRWARASGAGNGLLLEEWPVLEKEALRRAPELFRARRVPSIPAATSGSTGVPLRLRRSVPSIAAEQAFIDDALSPDWPPFRRARMAVLRGDRVKDPSDRSPPYGYTTRGGRRLMLSGMHISRESVQWYADALKRYRPDILYVYPSAGEALARHVEDAGLQCALPLVLSSSEMFPAGVRSMVARVLGAETVDYYGLAERVCFASSKQVGSYYFNPAYGHVELHRIPDESDSNAATAEVIATGFWNRAMPLVRFRTGDRIVVPASSNRDLAAIALGVKPFSGFIGRADDFLVAPDGSRLIAMNHLPRETTSIVRMQLIQEEPTHVIVKIVTEGRFADDDLVTLRRAIARKIPDTMRVDVERVEELVRLPSGKVPYVIRRGADSPDAR